MTTEERAEWLKNLKGGDQVCYRVTGASNSNYKFSEVKKITPTGMIRLLDGSLFNVRGNSADNKWGLGPYTEDIKQQVERAKLVSKASSSVYTLDNRRATELRDVSNELLQELIDLQERISKSLEKPSTS